MLPCLNHNKSIYVCVCVCVCVYVYIHKPGGIYFSWMLRSTLFVKQALELLRMLGMDTVQGTYLIFSDVSKRQVKSSFRYLVNRGILGNQMNIVQTRNKNHTNHQIQNM